VKDPIQLATHYIECSNAGVLETIWDCFEPDAAYQSSQFGTFEGLSEIRPMMQDFYGKYQKPRWEVEHYRLIDDDTVEFPFQMSAIDSEGNTVARQGVERLQFNRATGKITAVHVSVS